MWIIRRVHYSHGFVQPTVSSNVIVALQNCPICCMPRDVCDILVLFVAICRSLVVQIVCYVKMIRFVFEKKLSEYFLIKNWCMLSSSSLRAGNARNVDDSLESFFAIKHFFYIAFYSFLFFSCKGCNCSIRFFLLYFYPFLFFPVPFSFLLFSLLPLLNMLSKSAANAYDINRGSFHHFFHIFQSVEFSESFTTLHLSVKPFLQ